MSEVDKNINLTRPKIALVLGGGGFKGLAHIGVLKALEEIGFKPDIIAGCSMGAIIGACYAFGLGASQLETRAKELGMTEILDLKIPNSYGFIKGDKAEKLIRKFMLVEKENPKFIDCKIPFGCVATDISEGKLVNLTRGDLIPAVRASFSINGIFWPVQIGKRKLSDGGIFCRVPVNLARAMGADIVFAVDCIGKTIPEDIENMKYLDTVARIFNLMDYEISKSEINSADLLLSLSQPNVSAITIKNTNESIEYGYTETMKIKDKILELRSKKRWKTKN
ncbi:MAG: patatin-like phospholipase family protein [Christensenellales bacterium]